MRNMGLMFLRKFSLISVLLSIALLTITTTSAWALCPATDAIVKSIYNLDKKSCKIVKTNRGRLEKPGVETNREVCILTAKCEATAPFNSGVRCPLDKTFYSWADKTNKCPTAISFAKVKDDFKEGDIQYVKPLKIFLKTKAHAPKATEPSAR